MERAEKEAKEKKGFAGRCHHSSTYEKPPSKRYHLYQIASDVSGGIDCTGRGFASEGPKPVLVLKISNL